MTVALVLASFSYRLIDGMILLDGKPFSAEELRQPDEVSSRNGLLDTSLHVVPFYYEGPVSYMTRSYNGAIPGPTIRVKPGDTLRIKLINHLEANLDGNWSENTLRWPN